MLRFWYLYRCRHLVNKNCSLSTFTEICCFINLLNQRSQMRFKLKLNTKLNLLFNIVNGLPQILSSEIKQVHTGDGLEC